MTVEHSISGEHYTFQERITYVVGTCSTDCGGLTGACPTAKLYNTTSRSGGANQDNSDRDEEDRTQEVGFDEEIPSPLCSAHEIEIRIAKFVILWRTVGDVELPARH